MESKLSHWIASGVVLAFCSLSLSATTEDEPAVPWRTGERIEVELRTVPFYAVDENGMVVSDLQRDEVELRIDGKVVPFDTFDSYLGRPGDAGEEAPASSSTPATAEDAPPKPPALERRHVFLLFDSAFLAPPQFHRAQRMATSLLEQLPPEDVLYLLVNDARRGLSEVLGPVPANAPGKETVRAMISKLVPDITLSIDPTRGLDPTPVSGRAPVGDQTQNAIEAIRAGAANEYLATAEAFGKSLSAFAARMRSITEPKVFFMLSGGIDSRHYFMGNDGLTIGSGEGEFQVQTRYRNGLTTAFEQPLADLAASGAVPIYLHPSADPGHEGRVPGGPTLRAFRNKTGGLFFEGDNAELVASRAARFTGARYELGFYAGQMPQGVLDSKEIKVVSLRRGVRVWSASRLMSQVATRDLGPEGKRYWVVELVRRGLEGRALAASAEAKPKLLPGRAAAAAFDDGRRLVFEPDWSGLAVPDRFQLYDVLLRVKPGATEAELVHVKGEATPASAAAARLTAPLPSAGAIIWGVVAIERETGETWFRRFLLEAPKPAAAPTAGPSGR